MTPSRVRNSLTISFGMPSSLLRSGYLVCGPAEVAILIGGRMRLVIQWSYGAPKQLRRVPEPVGRIRRVVRPLRRLDAVQELLVDERLAGGGDWPEQLGGTAWVGARPGAGPIGVPAPTDRLDGIGREPVPE